MSQKGKTKAQSIGQFLGELRAHGDALKNDMREAGARIETDKKLIIRLSLLGKLSELFNDRQYDIEDRVAWLDKTLTLVGLAWGRGLTNPVWSATWVAWRTLMTGWRIFISQKSEFYNHLVHLEVFEEPRDSLIDEESAPKDKSGKPKIEKRWMPYNVRPTTAVRMLLEQEEAESPNVRLIGMDQEAPASVDPDPAFTEEQVATFIRDAGEIIMIESGLVALNYVWNEVDVTVQSVIVLQMMGQTGAGTSVHVSAQGAEGGGEAG